MRWFDSATHSTCVACVAPCSRILYCASSSASIAFWITLPFLGQKCKCSSANFLASFSVAAQLSQLLCWHPICWLWHGRSPGLIAWSVVLGGVLLLACLSASVFGSASFQAFFWRGLVVCRCYCMLAEYTGRGLLLCPQLTILVGCRPSLHASSPSLSLLQHFGQTLKCSFACFLASIAVVIPLSIGLLQVHPHSLLGPGHFKGKLLFFSFTNVTMYIRKVCTTHRTPSPPTMS